MPSFTFRGFETATSVALSAQQGSNSATASVATWNEAGGGGGNVGTAELGIQIVDQSSMAAPAMVVLRATPALTLTAGDPTKFRVSSAPADTPYEPWRHEITYIWRVRNTPLSFERAPHLNMPAEWKDANVYYGPEAVIVFDGAGTYHIDLVAVDRYGTVGEASEENIVVGTADAAFPGGATIAISDNSDFTGAPSGATTINLNTSSWADVNNAILGRNNTNTRVLMKAGVDFRGMIPVGSRFSLYQMYSAQIAVGSFGGGDKPILPLCKAGGSGSSEALFDVPRDQTGDAKFYDLDLRGGWQADRERGYQGGPPVYFDTNSDLLFHRVRISGQSIVTSQFRSGDCYFIWSDGEITNWMDMGIFGFASAGGNKRLAIIGSDIHQHENARNGGGGKSASQNTHGPVRLEEPQNAHLHVVDLFSRNGWSGQDQPALRLNTNGILNTKTNHDRVACEGGWQVINNASENANAPDAPGNHVFDKLLTVGTADTSPAHFEGHHGGLTIRNHIAIEFNAAKRGNGLQRFYKLTPDNFTVSDNLNTPISIYNTTMINLLTAANNQISFSSNPANVAQVVSSDFTTVTFENNVAYMPNQGTPDTATPVDLSTAMPGGVGGGSLTPRFNGFAPSIFHIDWTADGSNTLTIPYANLPDKDGNATNQAYWQARVAAGSTQHFVIRDGRWYADLGEISVSFGASAAVITKTTGVFANGQNVVVKLDQSDALEPRNPANDLTGFTVPAATLLSAQNAGGTYVAPDRLNTGPRAGSGLSGAPAGSPQKGAV